MISLKDIGNFETVPQIVMDIVEGNTVALDEHLKQHWNIEKKIEIGKYTNMYPLQYALIVDCFPSIRWLVEHGAELNTKYNHSFLTAVRYCNEETIRYLISHGAVVESDTPNGPDAFQQALYGKKPENLPLIHELGHTVQQNGGRAFARAVTPYSGVPDYTVLDFFISNGVDINCRVTDSVHPWGPTPLCLAARYGDLRLCKYLVEHGADVTLAEKDGMRPYSIAVEKGNMEMAAYFKSLEPHEFHDLQNKLDELKNYKLPKSLLDYLQGENLRLDLRERTVDWGCAFLDFFALTDTVPMKIGRQKVLRLSREVDNYSDLYIVWNPKTKRIAFYDYEHEVFRDIAPFDDFMENARTYMQQVVDGELD